MNKITICNGPSCQRNFSKDLIETAETKLNCKINGADFKEIELISRDCFNNCKDGPSVSINDRLLCQVTPKEIAFIVKTIKKGDNNTLENLLLDAIDC